jgi:hypothetical protein
LEQVVSQRSGSVNLSAPVSRTTLQNELCAVSRSEERIGPSPAQTLAAIVPPPSIPLIETCKMNDVDPQAWLADVLARLPDHPANKVVDLLPWNWQLSSQKPQQRERVLRRSIAWGAGRMRTGGVPSAGKLKANVTPCIPRA